MERAARREGTGCEASPFKTCSHCGRPWSGRDRFLADPTVELVGYQSFLEELELGLFLFNHSDCGTTLAIPAEVFTDLHSGPIFSERLTGTEACAGLCQQRRSLEPCPNRCECAWVREVLQVVRAWPKAANAAP
jgi:hypothetical protein